MIAPAHEAARQVAARTAGDAGAASPALAVSPARAFTLIEILIVITVILILVGLLLAAVGVVTKSVHKAATYTMVQNIQSAMSMYQIEDVQHRFPPTEPDFTLRSNWNQTPGSPPRTLDLLSVYKVPWKPTDLQPPLSWMVNPALYLPDNFGRPYYYNADYNTVGSATMSMVTPWAPAAQPVDWNAKNTHPYAYVWSIGKPTNSGDTWDALPANNIANWIYVKSSP
jgi:prepilin-type N-terminal cleavage/methylation domain-containing protein